MIPTGVILNNLNYKLALIFIYSFCATWIAADYLKRKFFKKGYTVIDMYKANKPKISNLGGTAALVGFLAAIVLAQVIVREFSTANLLIYYFIVIIHASFGLIDDLINTSNRIKIIAPYFMALPVALLVTNTTLNVGFASLNLGLWFVYLIAPVYLLVVTNLVNMQSGFNGLASGSTWILMFAVILRTIFLGQLDLLFYIFPVFGALTILRFYDSYPAQMIWGNIGSMMMGSALGAFLIITKAELFGVIILIPHIVDFSLYLFSITIARQRFEKVKFGKLRKDGTIIAPTPYKLKFLLPYCFRLTEKQTVYILYAITALFCVIGLVVGV
jgi:UDP-N-acetylglucosamine--dolichyl-phosphate N-acetylglucosaminephosphotransferase